MAGDPRSSKMLAGLIIMQILRRASIWLGLLAAIAIADMPKAAAGVILITPEEAKLPAPTQLASTRAITRGPRIEVSDIDEGSNLHSPLHFSLKFRAFGGSNIDLDSLSVTYLRGPNMISPSASGLSPGRTASISPMPRCLPANMPSGST